MSHITNPEGAAPASSSIPPLFNARRVRVQHIARAKAEGIPLTMLTAYDALTAPILEAAGVDMLLIGDSLGNVILGHSSTLPVTLEDMERATAAVARSTSRAMIVADLPFGTYEDSPEHAFASAARLMKAGAHAVKLEGGEARAHIIAALTAAGIPVCAHLGYTPQSENTLGGPRMQGRGDGADQLRRDSLAVQEAGAFAVVFEMVPAAIATELTHTLSIATIGIGAGPIPTVRSWCGPTWPDTPTGRPRLCVSSASSARRCTRLPPTTSVPCANAASPDPRTTRTTDFAH